MRKYFSALMGNKPNIRHLYVVFVRQHSAMGIIKVVVFPIIPLSSSQMCSRLNDLCNCSRNCRRPLWLHIHAEAFDLFPRSGRPDWTVCEAIGHGTMTVQCLFPRWFSTSWQWSRSHRALFPTLFPASTIWEITWARPQFYTQLHPNDRVCGQNS